LHTVSGSPSAAPAPAERSSPSGDSFATLAAAAAEHQCDTVDKCSVGGSQLELCAAPHDRLSVANVPSPADYVALPTVNIYRLQ